MRGLADICGKKGANKKLKKRLKKWQGRGRISSCSWSWSGGSRRALFRADSSDGPFNSHDHHHYSSTGRISPCVG